LLKMKASTRKIIAKQQHATADKTDCLNLFFLFFLEIPSQQKSFKMARGIKTSKMKSMTRNPRRHTVCEVDSSKVWWHSSINRVNIKIHALNVREKMNLFS
jgi:hypothetical protein